MAFPLHPETPEEGRSLEDLFRGQPVDVPLMMVQLKQIAQEMGLPFGDRVKTFNSRLAQELGKWAEHEGKGDSYHHEVFRAYFAEGKNIGKAAVLLELASAVGLSTIKASEILENRRFRSDVDADWARSHQLQITAVPTLVFNGSHLVGAQPYSDMETFLIENSAKKIK